MKGLFIYLSGLFKGFWSLLAGMRVTGSYFFQPWKIVTRKYPENRKKLKMFPAFKGELLMWHNPANEHRCTACGICEMNCPNGTIEVIYRTDESEDGKKKKNLDKYVYRMGMCTFCALCVKTCPSKALMWGQDFEQAVFNSAVLTKILNKEGSVLIKGGE